MCLEIEGFEAVVSSYLFLGIKSRITPMLPDHLTSFNQQFDGAFGDIR